MIPRQRLDALADGIYAVAMTLLVLDLRLPEDFHPADAAAFAQGLLGLAAKAFPYALSFMVLALSWLAKAEERGLSAGVGRREGVLSLASLFVITCIPFTTMVIGRFVNFPQAVWLYAGNILIMALISLMILHTEPGSESAETLRARRVSVALIAGSALVTIALSFVSPRHCLWALTVNVFGPQVSRALSRRGSLPLS